MDYFSPGLGELSRKLRRQRFRLRIFLLQRALTKAETELGLLGWQQADYNGEILRQVQQIQEVERQQSALTNQAAKLGGEIRQLESEREAQRKKYEESCRAIEAERKQVLAPHDQIQKQLAEKRKVEPNFEKRIPELDRELREVQARYRELLTSGQESPKIKQELIHFRERSVAIPNEKSDLRTQHLRTVSEIRALENLLRKESQAISELDERSQRLEDEWEAADREVTQKIRNAEKEKARVEKQIHSLEFAKMNPYQRIGQVLADCDIAPMNQPQALDKVQNLRSQVEAAQEAIGGSYAESAAQDQKLIQVSLLLWAGVIAGLLIIVFAAFH